eukprot:1311595-Amphidinium_carterae.2
MASASSNTPLDNHMFDDPPAEHAEPSAGSPAPAPPGPGLTPRSQLSPTKTAHHPRATANPTYKPVSVLPVRTYWTLS